MPFEMFTSLGEAASRAGSMISDHLGLSTTAPIKGDTVELMLPAGRVLITASDQIDISDIRHSRRRAVANAGTPTCWLTLSSPWDLGWGHEPAVHVAFLDTVTGMALAIAEGRFAFEAGNVAIADVSSDRWLSIGADGWCLAQAPVSRSYLHAARAAAIESWRLFVAEPARLI